MSSSWNSAELIPLKGQDWLEKQRHAGKVVGKCLSTFKTLGETVDKLNLLDIEKVCEDIISENDCTPTFKGYKGFPGAVCLSVNKDVVHGVPKDYILKDGDVVSLDLGATFEGAIADAAVTIIYGKPKNSLHIELLKVTKKALQCGIDSIEVGKRIGCIGYAINDYVKNNINNFSLIVKYGGHGISWNTAHSSPFVSNKSKKEEGVCIQPGLVIAIEPMLVIGSSRTKTLDDNWTVRCDGISAHFEHSLYVHENSVEIITKL